MLGSGVGFAGQGGGGDVVEAGAVDVALPHQSQVGQGVLLQHLDRFSPATVLEGVMPGGVGWVDGGDGGGERWRRLGFPARSALRAERRVQAVGLMARAEQVRAAQTAAVVAVCLVAPPTAAGEAAVVAGVRGGAGGLGVVGRRRILLGCHRRQAQKVRELQVAFV